MNTAGGAYVLGGTVGQHDAGPTSAVMSGGQFTLTGGFWTTPTPLVCACPGDMDGDGVLSGRDVQGFVDCLMAGDHCACADLNGVNGATVDDAIPFVTALLSGPACP